MPRAFMADHAPIMPEFGAEEQQKITRDSRPIEVLDNGAANLYDSPAPAT